jgi:S1-C subfamily serine protease
MRIPRPPDWLIYLVVVAVLLCVALGLNERSDAPPAPPSTPGGGATLMPPASPLDPSLPVSKPAATGPGAGTAFSVADTGVWVTARHVIAGCARLVIVVADGHGVAAFERSPATGEIAILTTHGGAPALPIGASSGLPRGERAFHPGFPGGAPGEVATRLIGRRNLTLVWAEDGHTEGMARSLGGLSGGPALDSGGRVVGVTLAQAPRRGRLYTTTPEALDRALAAAGVKPAQDAAGESIATDNYGRVADDLRRSLSVAQVVCLSR